MEQKENISFKKSVNQDSNKNKSLKYDTDESKQYKKLKNTLMKKYDISEKEAINVINIYKKKNQKFNDNKKIQKPQKMGFKEKNNQKKNISSLQHSANNQKIVQNYSYNHSKPQTQQQTKPTQTQQQTKPTQTQQQTKPTHKVDSILEDIIPDYNKHISIEVNNISLTFEVEKERIDTLKESFIRTIKRNKSEKIKFKALDDISFKIYKGEKVGIIGYNGAGKSTLLNVICGIYTPDEGNVKTYGNISPLLSLGAGFDPNYSGRKNIELNGAVLGYEKEFLESKIDEIIEFSELGEFIDFPIKNYSSGMLAKLGFSIATIVDPDILIIDEILGVGDVNFSRKSADKIKSLMDGGTTVLFVSHSIPQVREICDKAIWIDKGKIREIGEVNKICNNYLKDAEKASNQQTANIQFQ